MFGIAEPPVPDDSDVWDFNFKLLSKGRCPVSFLDDAFPTSVKSGKTSQELVA